MSELQEIILNLPASQRLELISFIAASLKEDQLLQKTLERREKMRKGEMKMLSLDELKARLYG